MWEHRPFSKILRRMALLAPPLISLGLWQRKISINDWIPLIKRGRSVPCLPTNCSSRLQARCCLTNSFLPELHVWIRVFWPHTWIHTSDFYITFMTFYWKSIFSNWFSRSDPDMFCFWEDRIRIRVFLTFRSRSGFFLSMMYDRV